MSQQPRGRPPSQAPPGGRGRNALTLLGGGVLVLAVAGGAWFAFGRESTPGDTTASGATPTSTPANPVFGPAAPGASATKVTATSTHPAAAPSGAATATATQAPVVKPTAAVSATKAPTPQATATTPPVTGPVVTPVTQPPVTGPQQPGTVAKKDYTFKVARGDTLWDFTKSVLKSTGRPTTNANIAALVTKLYQNNAKVIGADPDLIFRGQIIVWPAGL